MVEMPCTIVWFSDLRSRLSMHNADRATKTCFKHLQDDSMGASNRYMTGVAPSFGLLPVLGHKTSGLLSFWAFAESSTISSAWLCWISNSVTNQPRSRAFCCCRGGGGCASTWTKPHWQPRSITNSSMQEMTEGQSCWYHTGSACAWPRSP